MTRRLVLTLALLALAAPLCAQPPDSALTQAEIDQVREYRYYPADCVLLFVKFLDLRTQELHDLYAHPRRPGREQDTHDLILQFTSIADQLSDNLDDYGPRHVDIRRALPKILTAIPRWSADLNALPDDDAYNLTRRLAIESLRDLREVHHPARRRPGRLVQGPSPQQIPQRQKRPHRHPPLTRAHHRRHPERSEGPLYLPLSVLARHPERSLARTRAKRSRRTCGCLFYAVILNAVKDPVFAVVCSCCHPERVFRARRACPELAEGTPTNSTPPPTARPYLLTNPHEVLPRRIGPIPPLYNRPQPMPSQDSSTAQARIASALLLALTLLWCLYWFVHSWHYWEDDAFIHLEFARSLAAGRGFAFNGRVVAGDTAPLWVFLLAATHALIPGWLVAGKLLTVLAAALSLAGCYAFARRLASAMLPSRPGAALFPAAILLLIVANPYTCYWIFSGMEPLAASGLAFFAVLAATRAQPSTKTLLAACLLAGLAPLLRPEMAFLTALLLLPLLAQWLRLPGNPTSPSKLVGLHRRSAPARRSTLALGTLLPPRLRTSPAQHQRRQARRPSSLRPPPSPLRLRARLPSHPLRPPRRHPLSPPASRRRPPLPAPRRRLCLRASLRPHSHRSTPVPGLPLAGWIFLLWPLIVALFYIANHTYVQTRYILVTAPALTLVILVLALQSAPRSARLLYLAALAASLAVSVLTVRPLVRNKAIDCQASKDLALFIHDRLPPGAPVVDYSIGEIAFFSQHPILDTSGITRPDVIPYLSAPPPALLLWARSQGAQYWIGNRPTPGAVLVYSINQRFATWSLHPAIYATSSRIELWQLPPPNLPQINQAGCPIHRVLCDRGPRRACSLGTVGSRASGHRKARPTAGPSSSTDNRQPTS